MKKRDFLKTSSALLGSGLLFPLMRCNPSESKRSNWANNYSYAANDLQTPENADQVVQLIKNNDKLKALGTRHCFNSIADSPGTQISTASLNKIVSWDAEKKTVTVESGMKYGELAPILHQRGFALHNLASLPHISIGGAVATGTHGSGVNNGNLSTAVTAMEFVDGSGVPTTMAKEEGDLFQAGIVHLGAFGIVTKITLSLLPTFQIRQFVFRNLPLEQLQEHFEAIVSAGYSVSLFTDWQNKRVNQVWIKQLDRDTPLPPSPFFGATAAVKPMHPIEVLSAENCTEQMGIPGPWFERLPHFKMGFTPSSGEELQSEYFVPRSHAVEAILAIERLKDQIFPHLQISEIRTIAQDNLWLSPCYGRSSLAIHFTWKKDWESVRKLLPVIEAELSPFGVRPHWGKLFTISSEDLKKQYERMDDFLAFVRKHDPSGKFRNEFLNKILFS
jgi:alditol oxidase